MAVIYLFALAAMIAHLKCHSPINRGKKNKRSKQNINWDKDRTVKSLKVFLCGFVIVIYLQISGQEIAIRSEKWCCGYLLYLHLAWGRTAHRHIAEVYECPLACMTQISIYENSAGNVAAVYHGRIQSNNVKPQAGWTKPRFGQIRNEFMAIRHGLKLW